MSQNNSSASTTLTPPYIQSAKALSELQWAEFSCLLENDEVDLLRRYQHDNPRFVSFVNTDSRTRPVEEHVAESEVEKVSHVIDARIKARRQQLLRSLQTQPLPLHPTVPHPFHLRQKRDALIQSALTVTHQEPFIPLGDLLIKEAALAEESLSGPSHLFAALSAFYAERIEELPRKQLRYLERWATYGLKVPASAQATQLPILRRKLQLLAEEAAFCRDAQHRVDVLRVSLERQTRRNDSVTTTAGTGVNVAASIREWTDEAASASLNAGASIVEDLRPDDVRVYFNVESATLQLRRRFDRFVAHAQAVPMAKRYTLYEGAVHLLTHGRDINDITDGGIAAAASSVPCLAADDQGVLAQLEDVAGCFKLTGHDRSDIQEFVYMSNKKYIAVFTGQNEAMTFAPPPELTREGAFAFSADGTDANDATDASPSSRPMTGGSAARTTLSKKQDSTASSSHSVPYLRQTTWEPYLSVTVSEPSWLKAQRATLASVGRPHPGLEAECLYLAETDLLKGQARWRDLAQQHMNRASSRAKLTATAVDSVADVSMANNQAQQRANAGATMSLQTQRINVLYQLRFIRIREIRRKLLAGLNYLASVHRKIAHDCKSWTFPSGLNPATPITALGLIPDELTPADEAVRQAWIYANDLRSVSGCEEDISAETLAKKLLSYLDVNAEAAAVPAGESTSPFIAYCANDTYVAAGSGATSAHLEVLDSAGRPVMHQWALDALAELEAEMLRVATFFVARHVDAAHNNSTVGEVDCQAVLEDVLESEAFFLDSKIKVLDAHREAYLHCTTRAGQTKLAKRMLELITQRPRIDFEDQYFTASYTNEFIKLELEHTLMREMITSMAADARALHARVGSPLPPESANLAVRAQNNLSRFGFPDGNLSTDATSYIAMLPGTLISGVLELLPGLDHVATLRSLVQDCADSVLNRFSLQSHIAARHYVEKTLLEEFLVVWRLLGEEDRVARLIHHGVGQGVNASSPKPGTRGATDGLNTTSAPGDTQDYGSCLLDDLVAMTEIIREASTDQAFQATGSVAPQSAAAPALKGGKQAEVAALPVPEFKPLVKAYAIALDVLHTRAWLVSALYRTELLYNVHRLYARGMGVTVKRAQLDAVDFDSRRTFAEIDSADPQNTNPNAPDPINPLLRSPSNVASNSTAELTVPFDCEFLPHLAIAEFDQSMARFDFATDAGVKKVISFASSDLRRALVVQVTQQNALVSVVLCNQSAIDAHIETLMRQRWVRATSAVPIAGASPKPSSLDGWSNRIRAWPAPDAQEDVVDKVTLQRMYVSINQIKSVHRRCILGEMNARSTEGLDANKKPELLRRLMRNLKEQLLTEYCTNLLAATYQYAARAECAALGAQLRYFALQYPGHSVLTIGGKNDPIRPQPRSAQGAAALADGRRAATCSLAKNGRVEDARYVPHVCQLATFDLETAANQPGAAKPGGPSQRFTGAEGGVTRAHEHAHVHHQSHAKTNFALNQTACILHHWLAIHRLAFLYASLSVSQPAALLGPDGSPDFIKAWSDVVVGVSGFLDNNVKDPTDPAAVCNVLGERHSALFLRLITATVNFAAKARSDGFKGVAEQCSQEVTTLRSNLMRCASSRRFGADADTWTSCPWINPATLDVAARSLPSEDRHVPSTFGLLCRLHTLLLQPNQGIDSAAQYVENMPSATFLPSTSQEAAALAVASFYKDLFVVAKYTSMRGPMGPFSHLDARTGFLLHLTGDERDNWRRELARVDTMLTEVADDAAPAAPVPTFTSDGDAVPVATTGATVVMPVAPAQAVSCVTLVTSMQRDQLADVLRVVASIGGVSAAPNAKAAKPGAKGKRDSGQGAEADPRAGAEADGSAYVMDDAAFEDVYARLVTGAARVWAERELSDRNEHASRGGASRVGGAHAHRRKNQVSTRDLKRLQCAVMITEIHKLLLRWTSPLLQKLGARMDEVARKLEASELAVQHGTAGQSDLKTSIALDGQSGNMGTGATLSDMITAIQSSKPASREAVFTGFLNLLLSRAICVREDGDRQASYHIPEASLALALDATSVRLSKWQSRVQQDVATSSEALVCQLLARVATLENQLAYANYCRDVDLKAVTRRVQAGVADGHYALLFQNDVLRKEVRLLQERLAKAEEAVRHQVRAEYEDKIADLQRQLIATQAQYKSYQRRLYRGMQVSLEEIKRNAMLSVGRMESAPLHMKRQALKIAISDDELNNLAEQNNELRQTVAKTKLWYEMRMLRLKAAYEAKMEDVRKEADVSRSAFWGSKELHDRERDTLKQQLVSAQAALAQAEIEVDQLRRDLQVQLSNKKDLVSSKVKQAKAIENLTKRLKKFERFGQHDLDAIVSDYERRKQQEQLASAALQNSAAGLGSRPGTSEDQRSPRSLSGVSARAGPTKEHHDREIQRLRDRLDKERQLKEQAFAKVDELRLQNPDATESLVWQRKFYETAAELQRAIKEVESMRAALIHHGVTPPVVSTSSATAAHPLSAPSPSLMRAFNAPSPASLPRVASSQGPRPGSTNDVRATPPVASRLGRSGGAATSLLNSRGGSASTPLRPRPL